MAGGLRRAAGGGQRSHQVPVRGLAQRVGVHRPSRHLDRLLGLRLAQQVLDQPPQDPQVQVRQRFALGLDPLAFRTRQELAFVEGRRAAQRFEPPRAMRRGLFRLAPCRPQARHIRADAAGHEADVVTVRLEDATGRVGRLEQAAQPGEGAAEAVAPGRGRAVGPEGLDERLAAAGPLGLEGQHRQHQARLARGEARDLALAAQGPRTAQEL